MDDSRNPDARVQLSDQPGLLSAIRLHLWTVALAIVCGLLVAPVVTLVEGNSYVATAQMFLGNPNATTVFRTIPVGQPAAQALSAAQLMRSDQVLKRALSILGRPKGRSSKLLAGVSITPSSSSATVTIQASASSAVLARNLANAVGQAFLEVSRAQTVALASRADGVLKKSVTQLQSKATGIRQSITALTVAAAAKGALIADPTNRARFVQATLNNDPRYQALQSELIELNATLASVQQKEQQTAIDASVAGQGADTFLAAPLPQATSHLVRNLAAGAVLGLLVGAGIAWRRAERRRMPDVALVTAALDAPNVGILPALKALSGQQLGIVDMAPDAYPGDNLKMIASTLLMYAARHEFDHLVLTSVRPREGRSTLALNIAAAAGSIDQSVVLVDADVRRQQLTADLGCSGDAGLKELIASGSESPSVQLSIIFPQGQVIEFIPVGMSGAAADSFPPGWQVALPEPAQDADRVAALIDAPSSGADPTALQVSPGRSGLVVVVSSAASLAELATLRSRAELAGIPIVGFILNDVPLRASRQWGHAVRQRLAALRPPKLPGRRGTRAVATYSGTALDDRPEMMDGNDTWQPPANGAVYPPDAVAGSEESAPWRVGKI